VLKKKVTVEELNSAMKSASNESFGYTEDEIVSSDVIGITYGSLFDATQQGCKRWAMYNWQEQ